MTSEQQEQEHLIRQMVNAIRDCMLRRVRQGKSALPEWRGTARRRNARQRARDAI